MPDVDLDSRVLTARRAHPLKSLFANLDPRLTAFLRGLTFYLLSLLATGAVNYIQDNGAIPGLNEQAMALLMTGLVTLAGFLDRARTSR